MRYHAERDDCAPDVAVADLGVYVHFPWCRRLCPCCDFPVVVAADEPPHAAYLAEALADLRD
jgi:oxygen-independent coproporphyrinogen-3 oxidase